ncbi:hypothetical protein LIER_05005 [Lithospermum erythrorhizon]|uniref:Uncharacterized protein n=1 Tax=Lithospermum erythrorhizon TaxID=34254 RepID=A0AAV3NZS1_LITER
MISSSSLFLKVENYDDGVAVGKKSEKAWSLSESRSRTHGELRASTRLDSIKSRAGLSTNIPDPTWLVSNTRQDSNVLLALPVSDPGPRLVTLPGGTTNVYGVCKTFNTYRGRRYVLAFGDHKHGEKLKPFNVMKRRVILPCMVLHLSEKWG